ncbi:poly(glycerol-phosphate) alpha-glucosyltransferase [Aurantimicrobium minutum]|uniref:glycosyltransferase n=1 Tax=Aurantimicrobium minutum TaxID=708131 RepID=UPI0024743742|nr:glycosyltransferase [Aurantimicrobium minutum]MDH6532403.1 poly(glycerol-phosphate) alpha-glucosyltransferase [Aurantimicrobium minutum]
MSSTQLPPSNYVSVAWDIRTESGGLTITLLHRAGIMSQAGAGHVTVLTFDNYAGYAEVEKELRANGRLIGDVSLRNVWDWLRTESIPARTTGASTAVNAAFSPLEDTENFETTERAGQVLSRTRYAADNLTVLQVDHFREDGTLMLSDRRDFRERGVTGGRRIVLCDSTGAPVKLWKFPNDFYHWLLDRMYGTIPTTYIVDSKTAVGMFVGYRRRNALTVHVIQGAHIERTTPEGRPVLYAARQRGIESIAAFDLVATLTKRQRADVTSIVGASPNLVVIPNSVPLPDPTSIQVERPVNTGIVVAAFVPRKRVHLALEAVAAAHPGTSDLHLDVYGEGETRLRVEQQIQASSAQDIVTLHGYSTTALEQTKTASFILITSETEGTPLVLLEGMAAGCIPIAFDIPYGPSGIIRDRVNGFLIPDGDTASMAAAIAELQAMPAEKVTVMRRAAMASVQSFNDAAVLKLWEKELSSAWKHKHAAWWRALRKWQASNSARKFARTAPEIGSKAPPAPRR